MKALARLTLTCMQADFPDYDIAVVVSVFSVKCDGIADAMTIDHANTRLAHNAQVCGMDEDEATTEATIYGLCASCS